ncbi:transposase domain-containing protein [Kitasatospora sp. NPDC059673]|uniref:transposase domain-containing protein n=1 Tax=Kitasatospora sp. NPDC059673 TaxID=3346901 RepID=UPI0036CC8FD0
MPVPGQTNAPTDIRPAERAALGILTRAFPPELVDQVLIECGRVEQRNRLLPARVVVYFVLAMAMFAEQSYPEVAHLLISDLERERWWPKGRQLPTPAAIGRARLRLGPEPLRRLFERTCPPPASRTVTDAWYRGRRLVALDGAILDVPDTPPNAAHFGRALGSTVRKPVRTTGPRTTGPRAADPRATGPRATDPRATGRPPVRPAAQEPVSYPQARVSALIECGTHTTLTADVGPLSTHERALAEAIYPLLTRDMLVLADRGTTDPAIWQAARAGGADLLWQVPISLQLPLATRLEDGSHLIGPTTATDLTGSTGPTGPTRPTGPTGPGRERACPTQVRVIDYTLDTDRPSTPPHRLLTSLLDPAVAPAADLAARYTHQSRTGTALDHLTPPQPAQTLRSRHPEGIEQEIFALLLLHRAFPATPTAQASPTPPTVQLVSAPD